MDLFLALAPIDKAAVVIALLIVIFAPGLLRGMNDPDLFGGWSWLLMYGGISFYMVALAVVNVFAYLTLGLVGVLISIVLCALVAILVKWK